MKDPSVKKRASRGFSLVELLVVVGIIAIMAAISLPSIVGYLRHYKIRGAAQEVAKEIQAARGKAIGKNVNFGVVFLTLDATTYQWVIEDDQDPSAPDGLSTVRFPWPDLMNPAMHQAQRGPVLSLPQGVVFSTTCTGMGGPWVEGMRFGRLGSWCELGVDAGCDPLGAGNDFVQSVGANATICLQQPDTGLTRTVSITRGGRVLAQQ
jgi:prepilin-type N-terminal cleavage/methylation domain-containing protein